MNMNISAEEKFKDNISEILEFVKESAQSAAGFAKEQVPIFIEEILTYYAFFHGMSVLLLIGLSWLIFYLGNRVRVANKDEDSEYGLLSYSSEPTMGFWSIPMYIVSLAMIVSAFFHIIDFVKVMVAPRLYLLEYASEIINGGGC